jgi:hypothetical protein
MTRSHTQFILGVLIGLLAPSLLPAQTAPTAEQLKSWIGIRQQRVDLLRDEIKQTDARIESRIDTIVGTLKAISDSKDSRTKVARMKEDTAQRLTKTISYYDQKRAALKEELRSPRLQLTDQEKRDMIAAFDARIEKRIQQILALHQSMPSHQDYQRYRATGNNGWGTTYERNEEYDQNVQMTAKTNTQRDAIVKQLDASIGRLDRQSRALKTQIATTSDPAQRKTLGDELAKTDTLIAERRQQRLETLSASRTVTHTVALKEAMDLDRALQTAINDLRSDLTTLFQRYNTYLQELSTLHAAEAALAAKTRS